VGRLVLACYLVLPLWLVLACLLAPAGGLYARYFAGPSHGIDPSAIWFIVLAYALSPIIVPLALMLNVVEILFPVVRRLGTDGYEPSTAEFVAATVHLWISFLLALVAARWLLRAVRRYRRREATDE
jgi:hypothetical protein